MFEIYLKFLFPKGSISFSYERIRRGCYNYMIRDIDALVFLCWLFLVILHEEIYTVNAD